MSLMIFRNKFLMLFLLFVSSIISHSVYAEDPGATAYIELTPHFVVNHKSETRRLKYIKTNITLRTDEAHREIIQANMPLIKDTIIMFLASRTTAQVTGALAREETRKRVAIAINEALEEEIKDSPVHDVLFSSFVAQ